MRKTQPSPYDQLAARHPQFPRSFRQRVERGDTLADLTFWIRTQYGVQVSHETVRKWKARRVNGAQ